MNDDGILNMTKHNLEITNTLRDEYILQLIQVAKEEIKQTGITLNLEKMSDVNLIVMYAAYLYRVRAVTDSGMTTQTKMPRMLSYALNNRLFSEKMKVGDDA